MSFPEVVINISLYIATDPTGCLYSVRTVITGGGNRPDYGDPTPITSLHLVQLDAMYNQARCCKQILVMK